MVQTEANSSDFTLIVIKTCSFKIRSFISGIAFLFTPAAHQFHFHKTLGINKFLPLHLPEAPVLSERFPAI
jgi:hypothetical protein